MIVFKDNYLEREFLKVDDRVRAIVWLMERIAYHVWGDGLCVTSVYRNDNPMSPHYYWRAVDLAILEKGGMAGTERLRAAINELYPYGDGVHETIVPLAHGSFPHLHVQCKART